MIIDTWNCYLWKVYDFLANFMGYLLNKSIPLKLKASRFWFLFGERTACILCIMTLYSFSQVCLKTRRDFSELCSHRHGRLTYLSKRPWLCGTSPVQMQTTIIAWQKTHGELISRSGWNQQECNKKGNSLLTCMKIDNVICVDVNAACRMDAEITLQWHSVAYFITVHSKESNLIKCWNADMLSNRLCKERNTRRFWNVSTFSARCRNFWWGWSHVKEFQKYDFNLVRVWS